MDVRTASSENQLAALIPTFDPAVDNVEQWSQKIELLTQVWPESRLSELATRVIWNFKGSEFAKLQLKQKELLGGAVDCISQIVSIVGGQFGQVSLEQKFDIVEKAIFRYSQKADESADSYIARSEVVWTEWLMKNINLQRCNRISFFVAASSPWKIRSVFLSNRARNALEVSWR